METLFCSCGKESSGDRLVYIVDNDNDMGYCSKECINKHFKNTEDISVKQMTAKKALNDNFFLDTGDIVIADSTCFLVVETVNDYVLVDLSRGKVDLDNFETPAEIQTDLDRIYGNDNYQIIKKDNLINLLKDYVTKGITQ